MKSCLPICALISLIILSNTSSLNGAPLLFKAHGLVAAVDNRGGDLPGVDVGDPFVAIFGYDSDPSFYETIQTLLDTPPALGVAYDDTTQPPVVSFSIFVEGLLFETLPDIETARVAVWDNLVTEDVFAMLMQSHDHPSEVEEVEIDMLLFDLSRQVFSDADLPTSLDFADFDSGQIKLELNGVQSVAVLTIESIEQIPEPGTFVLCALGVIGLIAFGRRRRWA